MIRYAIASAAALALSGYPAHSDAQQAPPATEVGAAQLALVNVPAKGGAKLAVTTPAFKVTSRPACQRRDPAVARRRRSASAKWALQTKIALVTAPSSSRCTSSQGDSGT